IDFVEGKTVIRRLGILGEAAKNLSTKAKEKYPSVAWRDMARPRDLVVHHYWKIGLPEILEIATADVPALLTTFS
ncbi:MAG TPA: HepT-like ribonuclease domain-containing protein, partial [Polyangia bacterium]|nr:HepT-like ribonuclease domain-containing protein [Polyangia bacterium]